MRPDSWAVLRLLAGLGLVCSCLGSCCSAVETVVSQITAFSCAPGAAALAFVFLCLRTGISAVVRGHVVTAHWVTPNIPEAEYTPPRSWRSARPTALC